jgi:hypothetical protein
MIVERFVWNVKPGNRAKFVEKLSSYLHDPNHPIARVYTPRTGALDTVVAELEFDNLGEWEMAWNEWQPPEEAIEAGGETELATMRETTVWRLVE